MHSYKNTSFFPTNQTIIQYLKRTKIVTKIEKVNFIIENLNKLYPTIPVPLNHQDEYTLLIAVLLSAQSTDKRVNEIRAKEAAATGCGTLAVGCPFCSTMMEDGLKSIDSDMEVMDIAELMWNQMKKNLAEIENK